MASLTETMRSSWFFLQDKASKAARWLGYVPFEAISDARNSEPVIAIAEMPDPRIGITAPESWELPSESDLRPRVRLEGFHARQPYRLAIFGEKTSLQDVLRPIATSYAADLYLPSGEISDTLIHTMAKTGADDAREMIVLVLADCDPAGYQMSVSIGHKLRALHDSLFPGLRFSLIAPCLTVEQVRDLGLPSTPLKETERRADGWRKRYGVEQTEIDALATLRPGVLSGLVRDAISPYYDPTLADRVYDAEREWLSEANACLGAALETGEVSQIYSDMTHHLEGLHSAADQLRDLVSQLDLDLPHIELPKAIVADAPSPMVSSNMELHAAISVLRGRKDYGTVH